MGVCDEGVAVAVVVAESLAVAAQALDHHHLYLT